MRSHNLVLLHFCLDILASFSIPLINYTPLFLLNNDSLSSGFRCFPPNALNRRQSPQEYCVPWNSAAGSTPRHYATLPTIESSRLWWWTFSRNYSSSANCVAFSLCICSTMAGLINNVWVFEAGNRSLSSKLRIYFGKEKRHSLSLSLSHSKNKDWTMDWKRIEVRFPAGSRDFFTASIPDLEFLQFPFQWVPSIFPPW